MVSPHSYVYTEKR